LKAHTLKEALGLFGAAAPCLSAAAPGQSTERSVSDLCTTSEEIRKRSVEDVPESERDAAATGL
jgi:hypothetical protein